ncbi:MAG: tyrosine-type recombinase/integrase [Endomicrobium sp.]|jgi:site-specific recombinase XerD|nr:tyrosine-type recombinase/integrase [Endomicrobium sp.]
MDKNIRKAKSNNIFTCEIIAEKDKEQIFFLKKYFKAGKNFFLHTLRSYTKDIFDLVIFAQKKRLNLYNIKKHDIRTLFGELNKKNPSEETLGEKFAAIRLLYKFLIINNVVNKNPLGNIIATQKNKKESLFLTENEIQTLLNIHNIKLRNKTMIELLYFCELRIEELINLNLKNIDFISNIVIVLVGEQYLNAIRDYINERRSLDLTCDINFPLFLSYHLKRLNQKTVRRNIYRLFIKADFKKKVSSHTLKHTFATHLLDRKCDLKSIQEMLEHKNLVSTQIYTHVTIERLKEIYKKTHPRFVIVPEKLSSTKPNYKIHKIEKIKLENLKKVYEKVHLRKQYSIIKYIYNYN